MMLIIVLKKKKFFEFYLKIENANDVTSREASLNIRTLKESLKNGFIFPVGVHENIFERLFQSSATVPKSFFEVFHLSL